MIDKLWFMLSDKLFLFFGRECGSATIIMLISLFIRALLRLLRLKSYIPLGFIFSFPYFMQIVMKCFPFMSARYPLLTVRITETVLGRMENRFIFPMLGAHFIGSIFGSIIFVSMFPGSENINGSLSPIVYTVNNQLDALKGLIIETVLNCLYCITVVVLPELLKINKLSTRWLSLPLLPFLFIGAPNITATFNPAAVYALWYLGSPNWKDLQIEHIIGPMLGGYLAGRICLHYFPDDPQCWKKLPDVTCK